MDVAPARPKTPLILIITQCVVAAFLAWMAIRAIQETALPSVQLWLAVGCVLITAIAHTPPVFFRASINGRYGIYLAMVASLLFLGLYQEPPRPVTIAERKAQEAAQRKELEARTAEKLERCLSWRGQIGSLVDEVKGQLHNPRSFEHVETTIIGTATDKDNAEMTFRAENGFGALRLGTARAIINPDTCKVQTAWVQSDTN